MRRHDKRRKPRRAHVRHILVANKPEAKQILDELHRSKKPLRSFKKLAKKYSNCPSGSKGGDLGEFVEGQMVRRLKMQFGHRTSRSYRNPSSNAIWIPRAVGPQRGAPE